MSAMAQRHLDLLKWMEEAGGRITAWRESAVMTKKLAHIEHLLSKINNNSNSGDVKEAADMINHLKDIASSSSTSTSSSGLVASKVAQYYEELQQHLNDKIKQAVATLTVGTNQEAAASKCLITIHDWNAMERMGDLHSNIVLFSNLIMEHHINPLFQVGTSPTHQVIKGADIERSIYKILKSIIETAFDNSDDNNDNDNGGVLLRYTALFGDVFWPRLSREWVTKRLLIHQDDDDNREGRDSFLKIAGVGIKLETKARKLHFLNETTTATTAAVAGVDSSNEEEGPMTNLIRTATTKLYTSKQSDVIAAAQMFINTRTTNTVTIKNQYNNNKTYVVSESAAGLAELIQQTMKEASRSGGGGVKMGHTTNNHHHQQPRSVVEAAQRSVTDIVSLFLADAVQWRLGILSSSSGGGGAVPPYVLVIKYNDMSHIHAALCATSTLSLQHNGDDDDDTSSDSSFISQAMRVEQEAEQVMDYLLHSTTSELFTIIEDFEHFRNLTNGESVKVRKCQKAGIQLVHALRRLGSVLDSSSNSSSGVIMEKAVLNRIVVHVLHTISERLCFEILALSDISVEDSELIPCILNDFNSEAVSAMLPASLELRKDIVVENSSMTTTLQKLKVLCEIMGGRLVEIRGWWESGRLSGVGLTGQEVIRMIKALFEDTEHRREVIKMIRDW